MSELEYLKLAAKACKFHKYPTDWVNHNCSQCHAIADLLAAQPKREEGLRLAAEGLYKALMDICEYNGHCWCGDCDPDFHLITRPEGSISGICYDTKVAIDAYRAALAASPASGEGK